MQIPGPLIVAKTLPVMQNIFQIGQSKRGKIGKFFYKTLVRGKHGTDARLLQHDF